MRYFSTNAVVLIAAAFFVGCLEFGEDVELVTPNVTARELAEVSQRTGIQFPEGTTGLGYLFLGSGIDDALAIKVSIPLDQKEAFLKNELFQSGNKSKPSIQIGKGQPSWQLNVLSERQDHTKDLPKGKYVECTLGLEEGNWVAYITWIST